MLFKIVAEGLTDKVIMDIFQNFLILMQYKGKSDSKDLFRKEDNGGLTLIMQLERVYPEFQKCVKMIGEDKIKEIYAGDGMEDSLYSKKEEMPVMSRGNAFKENRKHRQDKIAESVEEGKKITTFYKIKGAISSTEGTEVVKSEDEAENAEMKEETMIVEPEKGTELTESEDDVENAEMEKVITTESEKVDTNDLADVVETVKIFTAKNAVFDLFQEDLTSKTPEEIAELVTKKLNFRGLFRKITPYETTIKWIVTFINLEEHPKSFNDLYSRGGITYNPQLQKKINDKTQSVFLEKYNVKVSFIECMRIICEKRDKKEDEGISEPDEVIIEPLERPPNQNALNANEEEEESTVNLSEEDELRRLKKIIKGFGPDMNPTEMMKVIVNHMGLEYFEKYNQETVKKIFRSIIQNREVNILILFEKDISLKNFSTAEGALRVCRRFVARYLCKTEQEVDVEKFLENLLSFFPITPKSHLKKMPLKSIIKRNSSEKTQKTKQQPGQISCFPKNKEFDIFLRKVIYGKGAKKEKIKQILKYMGIGKFPEKEAKIVEKMCIKNLYIFSFYKPENYYTKEEEQIVLKFINDFAKTLKEDANLVNYKTFLTALNKLL